jgi:AhpD family alkylhydroperoxidase
MPGGTLARRDTELVILRVAHLRDCRYEFEHHVKLGRKAGLTDADFERVRAGPDADGWSKKQLVILKVVDELHIDLDLSDDTWNALSKHLDEPRIIELCMLVGHYQMLATFIKTLRIELEDSPASRS